MKRFKNIVLIESSEKVYPFRFFCRSLNFLRNMLILIITLILFSWLVRPKWSSAWTARLYAEGKDLGDTSVMIGVASKAHQKVQRDPPDPNSIILGIYSPEEILLSEDIRQEGKMQYTWIIWVNPMGDLVPLDPNRTATLRWDFSSFSLYDLKDPTGLVVKLRDASDPMSLFLQEKFSSDTKQLLSVYDESTLPSKSLQLALINDLNKLIQDSSIYDNKEPFAHVNLSQDAQLLIAQNPEGQDLKCLNRLLLEEAYPQEIAKSPKFKPGTYELLRRGPYNTLEIAVADMKKTDSYVVEGIRDLTLVFTEADRETTLFSNNGGAGCFIATCASQK